MEMRSMKDTSFLVWSKRYRTQTMYGMDDEAKGKSEIEMDEYV